MARPGEGGAFIDDTQCVVDPPERPRRDARAGGPAAMEGHWHGFHPFLGGAEPRGRRVPSTHVRQRSA